MHRTPSSKSAVQISRRYFLQGTVASLAAGPLMVPQLARTAEISSTRPKVAVIFTTWFPRSHAHVILENFLEKYLFNGELVDPGVDVVSFHGEQFPKQDMSRDIAERYNIPMFDTIDGALCLGGQELAVDAVLCIGEHGDYPVNELGQRQYPRKRFFDAIVSVMHRSKRYVPLFNDKHLSYRWDWAKEMYDVTQKFDIPFMAGSSVPLAERRPPLEFPADAVVEEAVSIHGGPVESYDFHGLEVLQSLIEARRGGETGVSRVEFLTGAPLWQAARDGRWSPALAKQAMEAELGERPESLNQLPGQAHVEPHAILIEYKDGTRGTVLKVGSSSIRWNFACRIKDHSEPLATSFYVGPWQNRNLFKALSHAIQHHFIHREAPYPVERTLLTTGILDAAMHSRHQGEPLDTPQLEFAYAPKDFTAMREMGATWKMITEDTPEPPGIAPRVGLQ